MKRMLFIVLAAAVLWSGYWFVAAQGAKSGFSHWLADREQDGWIAEYSDLKVRGFPNRIDTQFTDLTLADPNSGLAWEMPFLQILALSYRPNHVIAIWPPKQLLATPHAKYDLNSAKMQASIVVDPDTSLPLNRANFVADTLEIAQHDGGSTAMQAARLAVQRVEDTQATYRVAFEADDLAPARAFRLLAQTQQALPRTLQAFRADLQFTFDRPWDRFAIERARPQPTEIQIKLAEGRWGQLELKTAGTLQIDPQTGLPRGRITIKATNWRQILALFSSSGTLPPSVAEQLEQGLSLMAQLSGNPKTLDVPLDLRDGRIWLGPVPVGQAPVLHLR